MQLYYLSQRKDSPIWYAALRDSATGNIGTKKSTGTPVRKDADIIAQTWLRDGMPRTAHESYKTFIGYLDHFWDFDNSQYFKEMVTMGKSVNRRHANDMRNVVRLYFKPYWGKKRLKEIDEIQLQDFLVWLKTDRGKSASTVNLARNAAFVAIKYAKRHRLIRFFDFDSVLRCSGKAKKRGILEREEVVRVFQAKWRDDRSKLINFIASQTGMRMGEIRALQIRDIVLDRIIVRHAWSKADGGLKCPKNGEEREIPLIPILKSAIMKYIKNSKYEFTPDCFLFPCEVVGIPYDEKQVVEDYYKVLISIGITVEERKKKNIVFHSWRHYCAKNLAAVTTKALGMKILGHKTSSMFDLYADHTDRETFKAMEEAMEVGLNRLSIGYDAVSFPVTQNVI